MSDNNPYRPTIESETDQINRPTEAAELIRQTNIQHESAIKSIGIIYVVNGLVSVFLSPFVTPPVGLIEQSIAVHIGWFLLGVSVVSIVTGFGLRNLKSWARLIAVVFSVIGLLAIPVGTLISGYFLYLLLSKKGSTVFSEPYKEIIRQTPHIKYETSIILWILLFTLLALIVFVVGAVVWTGG